MRKLAAGWVRRARPRWQRRKQARPGEMVTAALELFVERGFTATKLADVARRAGVTKGTVYLYFDSKEALLKTIVRETIVPALASGEQLVAEHGGSSANLVASLIRNWWACIGETRLSGIPKLMMAEAGNFSALARVFYDEVIRPGHRLFATAIKRGIHAREVRPQDVHLCLQPALAPASHPP